jgi:hypothetical protein
MDTYSHVLPNMQQAAERIDEMLWAEELCQHAERPLRGIFRSSARSPPKTI